MDPSDVYPDLPGEALSHSGQRLAQLGSLLTSWAMVAARRAERRHAVQAARSEQELRALREQEQAAWQLARADWAPAEDRQWLAGADLIQTARAWSAAAAYADTDPGAAAALARCEDRLRQLHPYAMARYDRLRAEGAEPFDAMQDALPLFARVPRARPGDPARGRPVLAATAAPQPGPSGPWAWPDYGQSRAAGQSPGPDADLDATAGTWEPVARNAAQLAAESFPWPVGAAVRAADASPPEAAARIRVVASQAARRPSRP